MSGGEVPISISECQRKLAEAGDAISRPTLTEYLDRYELKRFGTATRPKVLLSEVAAHRQANGLRSVMQGVDPTETKPAAQPPAPRLATAREDDDTNIAPIGAKQRQMHAQAEKAEIELEIIKGNLIERDPVDAMIGEIFAAMRMAEGSEAGPTADRIAKELKLNDDAKRTVRLAIKAFSRTLQARMVDVAADTGSKLGDERKSVTKTRIATLTAHAHRMRRGGRAPALPQAAND